MRLGALGLLVAALGVGCETSPGRADCPRPPPVELEAPRGHWGTLLFHAPPSTALFLDGQRAHPADARPEGRAAAFLRFDTEPVGAGSPGARQPEEAAAGFGALRLSPGPPPVELEAPRGHWGTLLFHAPPFTALFLDGQRAHPADARPEGRAAAFLRFDTEPVGAGSPGARQPEEAAAGFGALRLSPGPHVLRVEVPGSAPWVARFEAAPWRTVVAHVDRDEALGVTLLLEGAPCTGCRAPTTPVRLEAAGFDSASLDREAAGLAHRQGGAARRSSTTSTFSLVRRAADALRTARWLPAFEALRAVPRSSRERRAYRRLEAALLYQTGQHALAEAALRALAQEEPSLEALLAERAQREADLGSRRQALHLRRWNALTARYGLVAPLLDAAPPGVGALEDPGAALSLASARFEEARRDRDAFGEAVAIEEGRAALDALVSRIAESPAGRCALASGAPSPGGAR